MARVGVARMAQNTHSTELIILMKSIAYAGKRTRELSIRKDF